MTTTAKNELTSRQRSERGRQKKLVPVLFGQRLRAAREKQSISAKRLAEKLGCSLATLYYWESGHGMPAGKYEKKIKDIFGRSLFGEDKKSESKVRMLKGKEAELAFNFDLATTGRTSSSHPNKANAPRSEPSEPPTMADALVFIRLLSFILTDTPRRTNVVRFLQSAKQYSLSIDQLLHLLGA